MPLFNVRIEVSSQEVGVIGTSISTEVEADNYEEAVQSVLELTKSKSEEE